jgi:hypothetical protein
MSKFIQNHVKTRCFFANKRFHALVCDPNHKKWPKKSSTITTHTIKGFPLVENLFTFK